MFNLQELLENKNAIAFISLDEKAFQWVDEGQWQRCFVNGEKALI